jgi:hypothetical protein
LPFSSWDCGILAQTAKYPGMATPYFDVATASSAQWSLAPFSLPVVYSALYSLNYLHAGAPMFWVVVDP